MFVSFLLPDVDRGSGPLYHWVMLAQMARFSPREIIFLADEAYFDEGAVPYGQTLSIGGLSFACPDKERFDAHRKITLSGAALAPLYERFGNHLDVFREILTQSVPSLVQEIETKLDGIDNAEIEAFLTWCNVPSLNEIARKRNAPVIHNEIGPLRGDLYVDTAYFDFLGVNGHTAASRWSSSKELATELTGVELLSPERLRGVLVVDQARIDAVAGAELDETYALGVALQVQDDSNAIAFGNGWNDLRLLYDAISHYPPEGVLVRSHPQARLTYRGGLGVVDNSSDSLEFLSRVERVISVNSSLLAEAALWGVPFQAKGDCPFSCLAEDAPGGLATGEDKCVWLNAFFLGYLMPAKFLFDPDYYRWRLIKDRSLGQRLQKHISAYQETVATLPALKKSIDASSAARITRFSASWSQEMSLERRLKIAIETIARLRKEIAERDDQINGARNWQEEAERVWDAHEWFRKRIEAFDTEQAGWNAEQTEWRNTLNDLLKGVIASGDDVDLEDDKSDMAFHVKKLYELRHAFELGLARQQQLEGELAKEKEAAIGLRGELRLEEERHHHAFDMLMREKKELATRMEMESERMQHELEAERAYWDAELARMKSATAASSGRLESLETELKLWQDRASELAHQRASLDTRLGELEQMARVARLEQENVHEQSALLQRQLDGLTARLERLYASKLSLKERVSGRVSNMP